MNGTYFCVGLCLGMIGGAIIVANSQKARQIVKDGQEEIVKKAEQLSKCDCNKKEKQDKE